MLKPPSVYFFAALFLAGCIYTSMMNLQTTFAAAQGQDYGVFSTFYTFAVVFSRFALSKPISKLSPSTSMIGLLALMTVAQVTEDRSKEAFAPQPPAAARSSVAAAGPVGNFPQVFSHLAGIARAATRR